MTEAREDFETAVNLLADMLEEKLDGEVDFADGFEPWAFLRGIMPSLADRIESEAQAELLEGLRQTFLELDPNNASRMRSHLG